MSPVLLAHPRHVSPLRVFGLILAVVFAVEMSIMLAVAAIPDEYRNDLWLSLIDSAALVTVLCPALWILIVRPLRGLVAERGALLSQSLQIQEEQRARLSRDLHDELGQTQTAVLLGLQSVVNSSTHAEAIDRAQAVRQIAAAAVESTRRIARGLSPTVLRDFGLTAAVERICEDLAASSGIDFVRDLRIGAARFDAEVEIAAYRLIQEGVTNAARHARARRVTVRVEFAERGLAICIEDDGKGISNDAGGSGSGGLGMAGMRERVVSLGGQFRIDSRPSIGTAIRAFIPLRKAES